jgi:hypothetical protein
MKARTQTIHSTKTIKKGKKEETLLDQFKEAFDDIKHGRVYEWDSLDH